MTANWLCLILGIPLRICFPSSSSEINCCVSLKYFYFNGTVGILRMLAEWKPSWNFDSDVDSFFSFDSRGNQQGPFVARQMENCYFGNTPCLYLNSFQSFLNLGHCFWSTLKGVNTVLGFKWKVNKHPTCLRWKVQVMWLTNVGVSEINLGGYHHLF